MKAFYQHDFKNEYCRIGNNLSYKLHFHHQIELIYMFKGKGIAVIDGKEYILHSGDVLTAFPNQLHEYRIGKNEEYLITIFKPEILPEYKDIFYNMLPESPVYKTNNADELLYNIARNMPIDLNNQSSQKEQLYRGLLLSFFARLFSKINLVKAKSADLSVIKSILLFINENYKSDITLESVASSLHISKFYISHLLNDKLNVSFSAYVNSLRIADATLLLDSGKYDISEIAEKCGFNTLRTFNRAFKSVHNTSPSQYKKIKTEK